MEMKNIASLKIYNKKSYIGAVLNFMDTIANNHSRMEISRYNRLRYVVSEILETRIKKAYPGGDRIIEVDLNLSDDFFEVAIKDMGVPAWDDFSYKENPDVNDSIELRNYILNQWMDAVGIEIMGQSGQRVYVRMQIRNPVQFKAPEPYPETEVLDTNISIRLVETEADAIEAIRCIYSEYGYSYSYDRLYHVDSLLEMIRDGELLSFLAVNEHGQTAGHVALAFSDAFKNMPEISTVVVRREFRGLGLMKKIMDFCIELGEKRGLPALMGQPVAYHPMSQKALLRAGFTATSVMLSYIPSEVEGEYRKENQRLDLFVAVKILDKSVHRKSYPPAELYPFVKKIYDKLGWNYELCEEIACSEETEILAESHKFLKSTKIVLRKAAEDLEETLNNIVKKAIRDKNEMIELLISLDDASCSYSYEIAKKCKFALSGLIPGGENGDYLLMQMLLGADCHYEQLLTVGEFEDLKQDIIALNH